MIGVTLLVYTPFFACATVTTNLHLKFQLTFHAVLDIGVWEQMLYLSIF